MDRAEFLGTPKGGGLGCNLKEKREVWLVGLKNLWKKRNRKISQGAKRKRAKESEMIKKYFIKKA